MDKKLKGKPGESRRRKATELPRYPQRNVSGAARFDGWDSLSALSHICFQGAGFQLAVKPETSSVRPLTTSSGKIARSIEMTYSVVVYVRGGDFSVTARMTHGARLVELNERERNLGFTVIPILAGLSPEEAKKLKKLMTVAFCGFGLTKVTRPPL